MTIFQNQLTIFQSTKKSMKKIRFNNQKDLVLTTMMDRLEFFEKQIISLENEIKKTAKESEDVKVYCFSHFWTK